MIIQAAVRGEPRLLSYEVSRVIVVRVDCGCWKHAAGDRFFEIAITAHADLAFVRALVEGAEQGHWHEIEQNGPIALAIERALLVS